MSKHQVTIQPSNHAFGVNADETVLEAALREGFTLPYGCRNGACGACKGKVLAGQVDYGNCAESALPSEDRAAGLALFCQARPLGDLVIECREIGAVRDIPIKTLPCRVQQIERVAHDVAVLHLKLPVNERLQFLAGQYIDILLKDGRRRSFSLANAPHDDAFLQLHVRNYPGGQFSQHVFEQMKERDILRFQGPFGTFFLREDSDKPIILMAGGTGFAPVKGIVEHAFHIGMRRPMHLYWGVRALRDLYMREMAEGWARDHDNLRFVPVLSEPDAADAWQGRTGFVHEAIVQDFPDLSGYQVYACGPPVMTEAGHRAFIGRGLPEDEFYSDAFTISRDPAKPAA